MIGQWNSSEKDITIFISSRGDFSILYPSGNLIKHKLTVIKQNIKERTIVLKLKDKLGRDVVSGIRFSEDFKSLFLRGSSQLRYVYVDSKERP